MNYEEKAAALDALGDLTIHIRKPGNWYLSVSGVEIGGDGFLHSFGCLNATTPQEAVELTWQRVENLAQCFDKYLVVRASSDNRRHVRWNGYMWQDIPVGTKVAP